MESQTILGKSLKDRRKDVYVVIQSRNDRSTVKVRAAVEKSLERTANGLSRRHSHPRHTGY